MTKRKDDRSKRQKLDEIMLALRDHHEGLTQSELARVVDIGRSDVNKYLKNGDLPSVYEEDGRLFLDRLGDLVRMSFDRDEITMMHVAMRLLSRHTNVHNPHAASALRKLSDVVKRLDPDVSRSLKLTASQADDPAVQRNEELINTLRVLTEARLRRRKIKVDYELDDGTLTKPYLFSPYFIEPYAPGLTTHVIGYREPPGDIRTFKVERLRNAQLDVSDFVLPEDFDPASLLTDAWGIWYTNEAPVEVVLKFAPSVRQRVLETRWHRNQADPEVQADGSVIWRCRIAEPREMLPWVRGWGASVEVLAPAEMRAEVLEGIKSQVIQYSLVQNTGSILPHRLFWAKAETGPLRLHRLAYHMIDVGNCAQSIWNHALSASLQQTIATWLNLSVSETGHAVAYFASLHDLGKASPAFQDHKRMPVALKQRVMWEIKSAGLVFPERSSIPARHEIVSAWSLFSCLKGEKLLEREMQVSSDLANQIGQALSAHHGMFAESSLYNATHLNRPNDVGDTTWSEARHALLQDMHKVFMPPTMSSEIVVDALSNNLAAFMFAALVSTADWLGSAEEHFPMEDAILPLESYARYSRQLAAYALQSIEWSHAPKMPKLDFVGAFSFDRSKAQRVIHETLSNTELPALAIIEAPMGSGKTEAALDALSDWMRRGNLNGLYVAMPTTATSNQMHGRIAKFLESQLGADVEPLLVHSQALLKATAQKTETSGNESDVIEEEDKQGDTANGQTWFLPRKKSLLAPFGVGTVDQVFLSVLQTKHFFVRLMGLSHKVIIFDEVHAYDAYMSTLFEQLLRWLRQLGASVIVLSATLPKSTREKLLVAYGGQSKVVQDSTVTQQYPRLTVVSTNSALHQICLPAPEPKTLHYEWMSRNEAAIVERLVIELRNGGCAAVICNTVTRAQSVYKAVKEHYKNHPDPDLTIDDADRNLFLFHARFPMAWREDIERNVLAKFGPGSNKKDPNPSRPKKAIVIATQVIEQSLDLDFDVMISDHAPADLLLQRAGRLHRHAVNDPTRKHPYRLMIAAPDVGENVPSFGVDGLVYEPYVLLKSWLALRSRSLPHLELPTDIEQLVEQVYGNHELVEPSNEWRTAMSQAQQKLVKHLGEDTKSAKSRLIPNPEYDNLLWEANAALEEDDPTVHKVFQALTRSDRPGVSIVCLHRVNGVLCFAPDGDGVMGVYDWTQPHTPDVKRELLRHALTIRRPNLEPHLLTEPNDAEAKDILKRWRKVAALRHQRLVVFEGNTHMLPGTPYMLKLTPEFGLEVNVQS